MTSASKEGQLVTQFFNFFGSQTVRGSSRNNSVSALKSFIRRLNEDVYCASIAVDGPKGPALKSKPGILEISRITKKNVYSIGTSCSSFWTLKKTWDQTRVPKPFSKVVYHVDLVQQGLTRDQDPRDPEVLETFEAALTKNYKKALGILDQKS